MEMVTYAQVRVLDRDLSLSLSVPLLICCYSIDPWSLDPRSRASFLWRVVAYVDDTHEVGREREIEQVLMVLIDRTAFPNPTALSTENLVYLSAEQAYEHCEPLLIQMMANS